MTHIHNEVYPDAGGIPLREDVVVAARSQKSNNEGARLVQLLAVAQHLSGHPELSAMLLPLLMESSINTNAALTDAFNLSERQLMEIHDAQPVSIFSCLVCNDPLPVMGRTDLLRSIWALNYVVAPGKVGEYVPAKALYGLFCGPCRVDDQIDQDEQRRAEMEALQARQKDLQKMSYADYLLTPEWRAVRGRKLSMANHRCELCHDTESLNVHHRVYGRRGRELLKDLVVLCRTCHQRHHDLLPYAA